MGVAEILITFDGFLLIVSSLSDLLSRYSLGLPFPRLLVVVGILR